MGWTTDNITLNNFKFKISWSRENEQKLYFLSYQNHKFNLEGNAFKQNEDVNKIRTLSSIQK